MTGVLTVLAVWLAAAVAVAAAWSAFARTLAGTRRAHSDRARRRRRAACVQAALLAGALATAGTASAAAQWEPLPLVFLLAGLALATDAVPLAIGGYRFTGAFVALVLSMALLGPAPAVAIGVLCAAVDAARTRPAAPFLLNNLAAYATFPLAGALALSLMSGPVLLAAGCFVVAVLVNLLNFVLIAGHAAMREGTSLRRAIRRTWLPLLPWEAATAAMAALTVFGYDAVGPVVVAGFAVSLAVLQLAAARIATAADSPDRTAPSM